MEIKTVSFQENLIKKNIEELVFLDKSVFKEGSVWTEKNFLRKMPNKERLSRIVFLGETIIGYLVGSAYNGKGHIHRLVVVPHHQKMGIGSSLVKEFLKECLNLGLREITAETITRDSVSNMFFRRNGFTQLNGNQLKHYLSLKQKPSEIGFYDVKDNENPKRSVYYIKI